MPCLPTDSVALCSQLVLSALEAAGAAQSVVLQEDALCSQVRPRKLPIPE